MLIEGKPIEVDSGHILNKMGEDAGRGVEEGAAHFERD